MQSESVAQLPSRPQMNSIQDNMAITFIHALNSTVNYHCQWSDRNYDGLGIDLTLASALVGQRRTIASGASQINVQLKSVSESSRTMLSEDANSIVYNLRDDLVQFGLSMYLIVIVLPPADRYEDWRIINEKDVLLRARGYYHKVEGRLTRGMVTIPKSHRLTPDSYKELFNNAANEVES